MSFELHRGRLEWVTQHDEDVHNHTLDIIGRPMVTSAGHRFGFR